MSKVGDAVDAGTTKGIIFWINEDNTKALVMSKNDLGCKANWHDAMKICKEYDDTNWHLPNMDELDNICKSKLIKEGIYWSSTEYAGCGSDSAWYQVFSDGGQRYDSKIDYCFDVRPVLEIEL